MTKQESSRIKADYGMNDYFRFYNKKYNKKKSAENKIPKSLFLKITAHFNSEVRDKILNDYFEFTMPYIHMTLQIRKTKNRPKIKNGKLIGLPPINYKATKELWERDEEAKVNKTLVRFNNYHTSGYVFRIYCKKYGGYFKNKTYYKFVAARHFKRALAARIFDEDKDKLNAFNLY